MSATTPPTPPPTARPAARPDASMTLLREVTDQPLDPGYAAAARGPRPAPRAARAAVTAALAVALGIAATTAVVALRRPTETSDRSDLVATIHARTAQADREAAVAARLRTAVQRAQDADLAGDPDAPTAGAGLLVASGTTAVTGPGLVVTLDDAPGSRGTASADPRDVDPDDAGLVQDVDLREVTNGLWQAGAEAIAINGQRLTATSAIRNAGGAVLVDFRPLTPPYAVAAIGSPNALDARFALTRGATWLQGLHEQYQIAVSVSSRDHLALPALEGQQLFAASVLAPSTPTATAVPTSPTATASAATSATPTQEATP